MMLERVAVVGLANAALATLLALCLWTVYRRIATPHAVRLLAVVVLLRFLAPPIVTWGLLPAGMAPLAPATTVIPGDEPALVLPISPRFAADHEDDGVMEQPVEASWSLAQPLDGRLLRIGTLGWLSGCLFLVWIFACRQLRFRRALRSASSAPATVIRRTKRLARALGLEKAPKVRIVSGGQSPALMAGPGEPLLVLPKELVAELDEGELDTVLLHELAHLRRGDALVRWLEIAACTLFWWNPAVWWTCRRLRDAEEACCDEVVVRHLPQHATAYAEALVKTLALTRKQRLPATASTMTSVRRMEERLEMILHGPASRRRPWMMAALGVLGLGLVGVFPTFSQADPESPAEARESIEARFEAERLALEASQLELEERLLEQQVENRDAEVEQRMRQLALEQEMLEARLKESSAERERLELQDQKERVAREIQEIDERLALEASRLERVQRPELESRRLLLEAQRLEHSGDRRRAAEMEDRARALKEELLEGQLELETRELDLLERRRDRESALRKRDRSETREPRIERERRVEREDRVERDARLAEADIQLRRQEIEYRLARSDKARDRLVREYEGRYMQDEVMAQIENLRQLAVRLGDDGEAGRQLQDLEVKLRQLLEHRAREESRSRSSD